MSGKDDLNLRLVLLCGSIVAAPESGKRLCGNIPSIGRSRGGASRGSTQSHREAEARAGCI